MSESTRKQSRPRGESRHPLPLWSRLGDNVAEAVIAVILAGGLFCHGYVSEDRYMFRAWAGVGCALLGLWALIGFVQGRWAGPAMRAPKVLLLVFLVAIAWTGLQLLPLPSAWVVGLSGTWARIQQSFAGAGLEFPTRVSLAHSPENGLRSWHQMIAAALFFAAVSQLAARRTCSLRLVSLVALLSLIEGVWGVCGQYFWKHRAMGAIYNPNHHAALALMGLPVFFARMIQWKRFSPAYQDAPLISGTHPLLLFFGLGMIALLGWLNSLSRGSILLGGSVFALWISMELFGNWRDTRGSERSTANPSMIILAGAGYCILLLSLTVLLVSSSVLDHVWTRGTVSEELQGRGRFELWKAMLKAIAETPWIGLGLSGTETALNQYTVLPLGSVPIWAHNDYLQIVAELGLPASALILVIIGLALGVLTLQWANQLREIPWMLGLVHRSCLAGLLITLAHSAVDFHLRIPLIGFNFLILLALAVNQGPLLISPRMYSRLMPFGTLRIRSQN